MFYNNNVLVRSKFLLISGIAGVPQPVIGVPPPHMGVPPPPFLQQPVAVPPPSVLLPHPGVNIPPPQLPQPLPGNTFARNVIVSLTALFCSAQLCFSRRIIPSVDCVY